VNHNMEASTITGWSD